MTPNKLILKNFIGIKSGLGLDEIEIDLDVMSESAQLIAIQGENGKGKTTILDNLHPFRIMASRANSYSPGSFSYYDQTYGDAEKILYWTHNGELYRSTIKIKGSNKTKKTEAYLHHSKSIMVHDWQPAPTGEGDAVSDGKTVTYDKAVEHILGTPEMFFTSAFASQGKKQLSGYTNGEIKGLMSELLGLDHITDLGDKASQVVKGLTARHTGMQQALMTINAKDEELEALQNQASQSKSMLGMYTQAKVTGKQAVQTATENLQRVRSDSYSRTDIEDKKKMLNQQMEKTTNDADTRINELTHDMNALRVDQVNAENQYNNDSGTIHQGIERAHQAIRECNILISQKDDIENAIEALDSQTAEIHELDLKIINADEDIAKRNKFRVAVDTLKTELSEIQFKLKTASSELDSLRQQASLIDEVPCNGMDIQPGCMLLKSAISARDAISEKESEVESIYAQHAEHETRVSNGQKSLKEFDGIDQVRQELVSERNRLAALIDKNKAIAVKKELVETAEQSIVNEQAEIERLTSQAEVLEKQYKEKSEGLLQRISYYGQKISDAESMKAIDVSTIQEQLSQLPSLDGPDPLKEAQEKLSTAEQQLHDAEQEVDKYSAEVARLEGQIKVAQGEIDKANQIKTNLNKLNDEIANWKLLTTALGKDGIIALSIDDAGPTISSLANDLLLSCYGPRFTVSIDTQAQTAKGAMKETFDITVFDGERNEKKSIKSMSGGERVWINECITRAIALYQADQSQQTYGTLFTDETDGPLDPDRKVMFFKMKRAVLKLGGYKNEYFITHTPELLDMADAVIDLAQFEKKAA